MLGVRWRKVLRDIWSNKLRTVLVILSIAIGVFAVALTLNAQVILSRELNDGYVSTNPASAVLFTEPFDDALIQTVANMAEVQEAEGRRTVAARILVGPNQWRDILLIAIPDYEDILINQVQPERGQWPPEQREILLERSGLALAQADIGSVVAIRMPSGKQRSLPVVGLTHDLGREPAFINGAIYGYITFDTLEWLGEPRDFNELHVTVAERVDHKDHIQSVAELVRDKVEKSGRAVERISVPNPFEHPLSNIVQALLLLLGLLGMFSLLVSVFLVTNTISAVLTQHIRQIGVMKAVGARTAQIAMMYVVMVMLFGGLALVVALPLALMGARLLAGFIAGLLNFDLTSVHVPLHVVMGAGAIALIMPVVASIYPIITGTGITVREAISFQGRATVSKQQGLLSLLGKIVNIPRPIMLALRNTFRQKGRLALTLMTLTLSGAIFIAILSSRNALFVTLDDLRRFWQFDIWIVFDEPYHVQEIEQEFLRVPQVAYLEAWGMGVVRRVRADDSEGEDIVLYAPPAQTYLIDPVVSHGRWLLPSDDNALVVSGQVLRNEPDVQIGDEIVLKIDRRETVWRIVGIIRAEKPVAYANRDYYTRMIREVRRANTAMIVIDTESTASLAQIVQYIELQLERSRLQVHSMTTISEELDEAENAFDIMITLLSIMAVLLAMVGGLGLMGTMSINVLERAHEIGIMRAIGASNSAIFAIVVIEGVFIGVLSWFLAVLLAVPLSQFLADSLGMALLNTSLQFLFATEGAVLWLFGVVVIAAVASFVPAWNAMQLTVREVLAYDG